MLILNRLRARAGTFLALSVLVSVCCAYNPEVYEKCNPSIDCKGEACATLYQHRNYGGWAQCVPIEEDECVTLADWWIGVDGRCDDGRLSGVETHGTCVRLYTERGCKGSSIKITSDTGYLRGSDWEDIAKSISSCKREATYTCSIQHLLFGTRINEQRISQKAVAIFETVLSAATNSIGGFVPPFNAFFNVVNAVRTIASDDADAYNALIDANVDKAVAQNAAAQINAKIRIIENWLSTIVSLNSPDSDKKIQLLIALHTCEEVFLLFQDSNYAFSANKILSTPYLVTFSNVYLVLADQLYGIWADLRPKLKRDISRLVHLNEEYLRESKISRISQIKYYSRGSCTAGTFSSANGLSCYIRILDRLSDNLYSFDAFNVAPIIDCSSPLHRCVADIKETIKVKLDRFFGPTIQRLKDFAKKP